MLETLRRIFEPKQTYVVHGNKVEATQEQKLVTSEQERIKLAKELGNNHQTNTEKVRQRTEVMLTRGYKHFPNMHEFECKVFDPCVKSVGIYSFGIGSHIFKIDNYEQRIPMSVLIKAKEAREKFKLENLYIVDPYIINPKGDPWLIATDKNDTDQYQSFAKEVWLICQWEDKLGE